MDDSDRLPPEDRPPSESVRTKYEYQLIRYEAPLPPPRMLKEYEEALEGAADRILSILERQAEHRQGLENRRLDSGIENEKRGQLYGFVVALAAIIGSFVLLWKGENIEGIITFITTFAGLVGLFIFGKVRQSREAAKKRKELLEAVSKHGELEGEDNTL